MENTARRQPRRLVWVAGPILLGLVQLGGTARAAQAQPDDRALDALAVLLLLAGPVALLFLRRRPVLLLATVTTATLAFLLRDYPYGPIILSQVVATVSG